MSNSENETLDFIQKIVTKIKGTKLLIEAHTLDAIYAGDLSSKQY